jgi:hypothetical protein
MSHAGFVPARSLAAVISVAALLAACGGGAGSTAAGNPSGGGNPVTSKTSTAGVFKGTLASTTTGQSGGVVAITDMQGNTVWMSTDGRMWTGRLPTTGDHFTAMFSAHMAEGGQFPDGSTTGTWDMMFDADSGSTRTGRCTGSGDAGTFMMTSSPMWDRPSSLATVAGVYTRSTSSGYSMTMTISANGQMDGVDTRGCRIDGTINVPDAAHNLYGIDATVTSCGSLDGTYHGMGTLVDADAMRDWMSAMHPLEYGGHTHGGPLMGGGGMMSGGNTVPSGQHNLFMFVIAGDHGAMMDALAR